MSNSYNELTRKILAGLVFGMILGMILYYVNKAPSLSDNEFFNGLFGLIVEQLAFAGGKIFISCLKVLVVPLVFVSLVCGVCSLGEGSRVGIISLKTLTLYLFTTFMAVTTSLFIASIFISSVGGIDIVAPPFVPKESPPFIQVLIDIFPTNIVDSMAQGNMLQVIIFAILVGMSLAKTSTSTQLIRDYFIQLDKVIMNIVTIVMKLAPVGVFCLVLSIFARTGPENIIQLAGYFGTVLLVLLIHGFIVYGSLLWVLAGLNPRMFYRKIQSLWLFSFSTASSNASIPVTLNIVEEKLGVKNEVASFTVPLGATINMDGTAIMQGVATVFIAKYFSIEIGLMGYLTVIVTATMASIGTAGVPGVGLITLSLVLQQVGLPVEGIAMIIGVDRLLDMVRTAVNVTGDAAVSLIVARSENLFDEEVYYAEDLGTSESANSQKVADIGPSPEVPLAEPSMSVLDENV